MFSRFGKGRRYLESGYTSLGSGSAAAAAKREGRNQRHELPQVKKIQVQTAARTA